MLGDSAEVSGSVTYDGQQMIGADETLLRKVRGNDISFIFQEPMTSLNPLHTIDRQIGEKNLSGVFETAYSTKKGIAKRRLFNQPISRISYLGILVSTQRFDTSGKSRHFSACGVLVENTFGNTTH